MPRVMKIILAAAVVAAFVWALLSNLRDLNILPRSPAPADTIAAAEHAPANNAPEPVPEPMDGISLDSADAPPDTLAAAVDTPAVDTTAKTSAKPGRRTAKPRKETAAPEPEPKGPCEIPAPDFYTKRKPDTRTEAQNLSQWMWRKAACFRNQNLDSCAYYVNAGIGVYENASLFTMRASVHLERKNYSAAKTAAEISLNRNDHWNANDKKTAQEYKIAALKGLLTAYPSSITEKELQKAENELILQYGR